MLIEQLRTLKNSIKRRIIKIVPLDDAYPNLEKINFLNTESLNIEESRDWLFPGNLQRYKEEDNYIIKTAPYFTTILENVLYCPKYNVILTPGRSIIYESSNNPRRQGESFDFKSVFNLNIKTIEGYSTIWHSRANNYWHTLADNLPRLYATTQHPIFTQSKQEVKLLHCRYISVAEQFYLDKFLPSTVTIKKLEPGSLYKIEKLLFSPFLTNFRSPGFLPKDYREELKQKCLPQRPRERKNRIYISRQKAYNNRHITNEEQLLEQLEKYGFKNYILEKMTMTEQIDLFYDSECIVTPHGAGLTNILFAENVKILEAFPSPMIWPFYYYLAKSLGHTYECWTGNHQEGNVNFDVDVEQVIERLACLLER